ncbi:MAG: hypothetical protein ACJA01_000732, partial [Saprospiraceae bacterium]
MSYKINGTLHIFLLLFGFVSIELRGIFSELARWAL